MKSLIKCLFSQPMRNQHTALNEMLASKEKELAEEKAATGRLQEALNNVGNDHLAEVEGLEESLAQANQVKRKLKDEVAELRTELQKRDEAAAADLREKTLGQEEGKQKLEELTTEVKELTEQLAVATKEREHYSNLVTQCFEKMQRESADKMYWVDRRTAVEGLLQFMKVDKIIVDSMIESSLTFFHFGDTR